jgi:hypothetical protein
MQSPSAEPTHSLDDVNLTTLSLEPARSNAATSRHIFAFESGATWGTSGATGGNDWGVPAGNDKPIGAATFLSLSSTNTWGTSAVPGLGGTLLHGDHTTTGD